MSKNISTKSLTPQEYFTQGNEFYSSGRYTDALGAYDNAIRLKPDFADAYYNKGNTLDDCVLSVNLRNLK